MGAFSKATIILLFLAEPTFSQTYCRFDTGSIPHQQSLWQDDFPTDEEPYALCEGSVTVDELTGEICTVGRVNYEQIEAVVGRPIRTPAAKSISVPGHLITGSANVVLGTEANFLYDYVTRYSIGGVTYEADNTIADKMFAASRGLIDAVCFDASLAQDETRYSVSHDIWLPSGVDLELAAEANLLYFSSYSIVAEYYELSNRSPFFGHITNRIVTILASLPPPFVFRFLPLLGCTGFFRLFVFGTMSTDKFSLPIESPPVIVEDVQIDTEWSTLIAAMDAGLFTEDKLPLYFGAFVKKVEPGPLGNGCWDVTAASIDIQAPTGRGDRLDEFIAETVLPALSAFGNVAVHFGKRLDSGSELVKTALATYNRQCNVELDVEPVNCYHPACRRTDTLTTFEYPAALYEER